MHAGVFDFVLKSADTRTLTAAVGRALRHFQVLSENRRLTETLRESNEALERRVEERTQSLVDAQAKLVEAARRAGMAEIAAFVLHNVGNVLNHLGVATSRLAELTEGGAARTAHLDRAMRLLTEHQDRLAEYLTRDPKGMMLPRYLRLATAALLEQQEALRRESELIGKGLEHVRNIVTIQQRYVGCSVLTELVRPRDLLEDALRMNAEGLERQGIRVVRELAELPEAMLDRHKIVQILINLVSNAQHALAATAEEARRLTVRMSFPRPGEIVYQVADSGMGIARENLTRIFEHGFSTRGRGHGLGLHGSANLAAEMGGSLQAESEGPGRGATFTLRVPVHQSSVAGDSSSNGR
jgi:signal transduction histidine kinase